ncbi:hypothetical protein [Lacrimispora defluvii]|uniref:Uncharacterized protein n=1 Tax=Lacrimispora defluvii TaxID=2719233 RepID=A0ABX1VW76_9FIRM|nr:hypothetical protein [Lacrimispora defluvii]NNJ32667.1 hypothetical protein [Lacrimispora defluvii]
MCSFNTNNLICQVCGKPITYPKFRIEWGYKKLTSPKPQPFDFIQMCHEDCSWGIQSSSNNPTTFGDMIFDQVSYDASTCRERLDQLLKDNPPLQDSILAIKENLFK